MSSNVSATSTSQPTLLRVLRGSAITDDRGVVGFVNQFDPQAAGIRRFYVVSSHRRGFVRAWHAHRRERKFVTVVEGAALVCAVAIDDWAHPNLSTKIHRYVLTASDPAILAIPAGYANGWMPLTDDAKLMFFSTSTLEESREDDVRFAARLWNPWEVEER